MKTWTLSSWQRWEEKKPTWITDGWIDGVPNEFIPFEFCVKYKMTKGRVDDAQLKLRRGSVAARELVGGGEEEG